MDAGAGGGGMEDDAGGWRGAVGELGALIGVKVLVGLAGGGDLNSARGEERTQADAEGEVDVFLDGGRVDARAGVVAAVGRVDEDEEVRGGCRRSLR